MMILRKHSRLFILIALELLMILVIVKSSLGDSAAMSFSPEDFADNVRGRENITVDSESVRFTPDLRYTEKDDEGRIMGEEMLSAKFAIGSGAYDITVDYQSDSDSAYVELYSESQVTEMVTPKIFLVSDRTQGSSKVYIPFGRSMHDIQMCICYNGDGDVSVSGITVIEDTSYRWVPPVGYLLLFILLDMLLWIVFARSAAKTRAYIRQHYEIPAVAVIIGISSLPLFADFIYMGHDLKFHLARIIAEAGEISYGQFPVRMLTDMLKGYSYPTSTFYCDFFLYPFALLYSLGLPLRMCWQSYCLLMNAATALISYFCAVRAVKDRNTGITICAVYTLGVYRLIDMYLRSAMGEFTAITFIPLVVLGIWMIFYEEDEDNKGGWLYLGTGMTAIALCHLLSLEMITAFLILFCLVEFRKTFTVSRLISIGKAALMTMFVSAWFIFPMLLSMKSVSLSMYEHQSYIQNHGAYPSQIFNLFMGGSGTSTVATPSEMPLSIGGGLLVSLALLLMLIIRGLGDGRRKKILLSLTAVSLVFSMYFFPWDSIAGMTEGRFNVLSRLSRMVQFPWRFHEITTVLLAMAALWGLFLYRKMGDLKGYRFWTGLLIMGTLISAGVFFDSFVNETSWTRALDEQYIEKSIGQEEYLPAQAGRLMDLKYEVETVQGEAEVSSYESINGERRITVSDPGDGSKILIPLFAYPGFSAQDADTGADIAMVSGDLGRAELSIPGGYSGTIRVFYKEPVLWHMFEAVSLISFLIYTVLFVRMERKRE